jgi:hypothetical protein
MSWWGSHEVKYFFLGLDAQSKWKDISKQLKPSKKKLAFKPGLKKYVWKKLGS